LLTTNLKEKMQSLKLFSLLLFIACVASRYAPRRQMSRDEAFMSDLKRLHDHYYGSIDETNDPITGYPDYNKDCSLTADTCDADHLDKYGNVNPRLKCKLNGAGQPKCKFIYG